MRMAVASSLPTYTKGLPAGAALSGEVSAAAWVSGDIGAPSGLALSAAASGERAASGFGAPPPPPAASAFGSSSWASGGGGGPPPPLEQATARTTANIDLRITRHLRGGGQGGSHFTRRSIASFASRPRRGEGRPV